MSEIPSRSFSVPLNRCNLTDQMKKALPYPPVKEFEQLKNVRKTVAFRLDRQKELIGKMKRGKFKLSLGDIPIEMVLALAQSDLKILQQAKANFEQRSSELRRKIHEDVINSTRYDPDEEENDDSTMNGAT